MCENGLGGRRKAKMIQFQILNSLCVYILIETICYHCARFIKIDALEDSVRRATVKDNRGGREECLPLLAVARFWPVCDSTRYLSR